MSSPKKKYDPLSNHLKTQTVKENHKIYILIYAELEKKENQKLGLEDLGHSGAL